MKETCEEPELRSQVAVPAYWGAPDALVSYSRPADFQPAGPLEHINAVI